MRFPTALVLLLGICLPAFGAGSGDMSVAALLDRCRAFEIPGADQNAAAAITSNPDSAYCIGHINGFRETLLLSVRLHRKAGFKEDWKSVLRICIPGKQISSATLAQIFTHWAKANTERGKEPATIGIYDALRQAYPCVDTYR